MFYGWAYRRGYTATNPAADLPTVHVPFAEPRPATDEAIQYGLDRADARQWLMLMLAGISALRVGEISRVRTDQLDARNDLTVIGKGGRVRIVRLPPPVADAVRARPAGWVFVSPAKAGHLTPGHVGKLMKRALPPGTTPHQLRHAAASHLHAMGVSLVELRQLLGHASLATTQLYVRVIPKRTAAAIEDSVSRFAM